MAAKPPALTPPLSSALLRIDHEPRPNPRPQARCLREDGQNPMASPEPEHLPRPARPVRQHGNPATLGVLVHSKEDCMSIGGHQSAAMKNDEWLTPPGIVKALGNFDLDPCAPSDSRRPWDTAKQHFSVEDDGLSKPWVGRVWCNPPYGSEAAHWLKRMAEHGNGIALIFARTETAMFFEHVWKSADAVLFVKGRLHFHYVDGSRAAANSGAPSALIAYGKANVDSIRISGIAGALVDRWT